MQNDSVNTFFGINAEVREKNTRVHKSPRPFAFLATQFTTRVPYLHQCGWYIFHLGLDSCGGAWVLEVQGYLAHKKQPPP